MSARESSAAGVAVPRLAEPLDRLADDGPAWLASRRREGMARFLALGFPSPDDEEWRQTPVAAIARTDFRPAEPAPAGSVAWEGLALDHAADGPRIVLINGRFEPSLSALGDLPDGLEILPLREAARAEGPGVAALLGSVARTADRAFASLNDALWTDGALVRVAAGTAVEPEVHVVHVTVPSGDATAWNPRTLIVAGDGSELHVTETFTGLPGATYLTNAVSEIAVGANAEVHHVRVQAEPDSAYHVGLLEGRQARDARLVSHNLSWGAALARHDVGSRLDGEGAECLLYGIAVASGRQHVDNHTSLDHAKPHCPSWELYKSILSGAARSVFNGRIVVRPDAQKTDAKQSNRNLLLSRDALAYTRPQLEIYANDVKCTHGATVGRLDDDALFYLRARGIGTAEARDLLVHAFAGEVLEAVKRPGLRRRLEAELWRRLPRAGRD